MICRRAHTGYAEAATQMKIVVAFQPWRREANNNVLLRFSIFLRNAYLLRANIQYKMEIERRLDPNARAMSLLKLISVIREGRYVFPQDAGLSDVLLSIVASEENL